MSRRARPPSLRTKRAYAAPAPEDGTRILIDRLWPRGLSKADAAIDLWHKDAAPSTELRRWFDHRADRWDEFRRRYRAELDARPGALDVLREHLAAGPVTLVFGSREERLNNAAALVGFLSEMLSESLRDGDGDGDGRG